MRLPTFCRHFLSRVQVNTLLPGADTVGRGLKELAEENIVYKCETSGKS